MGEERIAKVEYVCVLGCDTVLDSYLCGKEGEQCRDYALESATRILKMVSTKKVDKKPYELWYVEFLEKKLISQKSCGRAVELEEIQDEDTSPSENTCKIPIKVKDFERPQEDETLVRRFKMDNSKLGNILMQERLDLNKTQGASTPEEVKRMQMFLMLRLWDPLYEYIAAMEAVWIRKFTLGLGIVPTINEPIKMLCDNSAALLIANEPRVQKGVIHYHRRYHYVRECIELGEINLLKVHTYNNLTYPFTKVLPKVKLTQHARSIRLRLASSLM
nr:hypothetical protein [Tanacetum cinerariifolium]